MKKKIALIGLGNIGLMYDLERSNSYILTYAKAIHKLKNIKFVGAVDIDKKKRSLFEKKYKITAFKSLSELFLNSLPDILIISTPTKTHLNIIKQLIKYNLKLIVICEKPITESYEKIKIIEKIIMGKNIKLYTNYMRLADPKIKLIKKHIKKYYNSKFFCEVFYNGTVLNNCSHYISIITSIFGNKYKINVLNKKKDLVDFKLTYKNSEVFFYSSTMRKINYENIKILNDKAIFSYKNGGVDLIKEKSIKNPIYGSGSHYIFSKSYKDNFYKQSQKFTVDQILNLLSFSNNRLIANLDHAKQVHYIIKKIYEKKK